MRSCFSSSGIWLLGSLVVTCLLPPASGADDLASGPLHSRIDRLVMSQQTPPVAAPTSDAEFLRRVSLDLVGTIPAANQARAFLHDAQPEKRTALVDRLLSSQQFARHMTDVLDVMLMERRPTKYISVEEWRKYLRDSLAAGKPLHDLFREILSADGSDGPLRPAARFYLDREGEQHALTRAVGRIFFGKDLQCAQCHDHPLVADYAQADYHGILAHLNRSSLFLDKKNKDKAYLAEKAEGETSFVSVFDSEKTTHHALPTVPGGRPLADPQIPEGAAYKVAPADGVRPVPTHSRRASLATATTCGDCDAFNRNLANRLWAHMLGRGLVEPVDMHHGDNPPTYPRVLKLLADELADSQFDLRYLLREIALSEVYQRSCTLPTGTSGYATTATAQLDHARAEETLWAESAEQSRAAIEETLEDWEDLRHELTEQATTRETARQAIAQTKKELQGAAVAVEKAGHAVSPQRETATTLAAAAGHARHAAERLPKDQQLAAAVQTIVDRAEQSQQLLAEAEKQWQQAQANLDQATRKKEAADQALADAQAGFSEVASRFADVTETRANQHKEFELQDGLAAQAGRRLKEAHTLIRHVEQQQAIARARDEVEQARTALAEARQRVADQTAKQGPLAAAVAEAEQTVSQNRTALQQLEHTRTAKQQAQDALQLAVQATEDALQQLPGDSALLAAAAKLRGRLDAIVAESRDVQVQLRRQKEIVERVQSALAAAETNQLQGTQQVAELTSRVESHAQAAAAAQQRLADLREAANTSFDELVELWTTQGAVAALKPLTPEQLARSAMQATGWLRLQQRAAQSQWEQRRRDRGAPPLPLRDQLRDTYAEQKAETEVNKAVGQFVALFAAGGGSPRDFQATVDQALFLANGGTVRRWLAPKGNNLTDRLRQLDHAQAIAEELFLSVLTRHPTAKEVADVDAYLSTRTKDRAAALGEIAWALLTSTEFRFNH